MFPPNGNQLINLYGFNIIGTLVLEFRSVEVPATQYHFFQLTSTKMKTSVTMIMESLNEIFQITLFHLYNFPDDVH